MQTVTVYDKGPTEPVKPPAPLLPDHLTQVEQDQQRAYAQAVVDHKKWHETNKEPVAVTMATVDANHAVAVDPDRYSYDSIPAHVPNLGLEDRITILERRLVEYDDMHVDDLKAYREQVAAKRAEDAAKVNAAATVDRPAPLSSPQSYPNPQRPAQPEGYVPSRPQQAPVSPKAV